MFLKSAAMKYILVDNIVLEGLSITQNPNMSTCSLYIDDISLSNMKTQPLSDKTNIFFLLYLPITQVFNVFAVLKFRGKVMGYKNKNTFP